MKKQLFFYLGILLFFVACEKKKPATDTSSDNAVRMKVNELYSKYGKSNEAVYNQPIPEDLFSKDLKETLENAIHASKADIEKVKNSNHPDEKPLIFEGAMFSSLYEGFTAYKIKSVNIQDKTADAQVEFEYNMSSPKVTWIDTVHLINTEKGWKIDNVIFDTIGNSKGLKARLTEFVQSTK
ncbi:hypothetical protein DBR39_07210 [Chryseobacterium sp. KBW03]|uniref:DUF3828 domain-containing protein n=1 Tax=Chryseobacterium sp. KBW03 TaxID=2153362 RepID=UPI000F5B6830|nr:DUF3828 domain-containing protein [Chryseobacterium sp. KBW03]RQO40718.1 hypothetical protein DBR39_07210 [Chryseobacterium sp. KBW03]